MQDHNLTRSSLWLLCAVLLTAFLSGCFPESPPGGNGVLPTGGSGGQTTEEPDAGGGAPHVYTGKCLPVVGEPLPLRSEVLSATAAPTKREVPVSEVFNQFKVQCGSCHVETNLGGLKLTATGFNNALQNPFMDEPILIDAILDRIETSDLTKSMPQPTTITYAQRPESDPVRKLDRLLRELKAAGYPADIFYEDVEATSDQNSYALDKELGTALTNIGTCVPEKDFPYATDRKTMAALDDKFAALKPVGVGGDGPPEQKLGLPLDLADTDLTTFDSDALARTGVISFAPAYPLWSDDAGKIRYVRVPLDKSIVFDPKKQSFSIPDNTRFYKTFLKEVIDKSGKKRWKKMETRVIVARADAVAADGKHTPQALFGTYEWDETETHATLLIDTLRNGDPFTDHLFEYETDEPAADKVRAKKPLNLTYELEYEKLVRHYAVPGSTRCMHCHMGSDNSNFVIGFLPLQINRRPMGEGGVYEPATADELNQMQRLIDLGVVTGMSSPSEVTKLEDSQGTRKPRNDQELKAQAYMLANCAHCHNENGYPSVASPVLKAFLDFYPSADDGGGIFQFPLERFSPRISHGYDNSPIPYITPSLRDIVPPPNVVAEYTPKFSEDVSTESASGTKFLSVPWRSLIYRNVQTAFTYADSYTLYPHMPHDTGGYDCRAPQWLGEWMVSIPAVRKHPDLSENFTDANHPEYQDTEPQPYKEVLPGEDGYDAAVAAAKKRLATYRNDPEYSTCPDTADIVDPDVLAGRYPSPQDKTGDGVPDHANWVVTDLTERKGLWEPRRTDWKDVLYKDPPMFPKATPAEQPELDKQIRIVAQIHSVHLSDLPLADKPIPLALWQKKPGCTFKGPNPSDPNKGALRTVSSFSAAERPAWFDRVGAAPDAPVYEVLPGEAIFDMICVNCHGPNADSLGRQADTLQNLTGGLARVANFRFGLFNPKSIDDPADSPDRGALTNRQRVFGEVASNSLSVDDWGARYLSWMALGGTGIHIPSVILDQVARTDVAGSARPGGPLLGGGQLSANMLQAAQVACEAVLGEGLKFDFAGSRKPDRSRSKLIVTNGDAELWIRLCTSGNAGTVHKILVTFDVDPPIATVGPFLPATACDGNGQPANCYPADAPIGDGNGNITYGLDPDNTFPWCLDRNPVGGDFDRLTAFANQYAVDGVPLPICPPDWSSAPIDDAARVTAERDWAAHGAINAGLSVFKFLDHFIKDDIKHVGYDQCDLLTPQ